MLEVGVLIAESIGLNNRHLFTGCLCTLARPHKTPKCEPAGLSLYVFLSKKPS